MGQNSCSQESEKQHFTKQTRKDGITMKMKKRIFALLATVILCAGLIAMPSTASAASSESHYLNGIRCYSSVRMSTTDALASTQFGITADYVYAHATFRYAFNDNIFYTTAVADGTGINSVAARANKSGGHTYIDPLGGLGVHEFYYRGGSYSTQTIDGNMFYDPS